MLESLPKEPPVEGTPATDRRIVPRYAYSRKIASCGRPDQKVWRWAEVKDVSQDGIGLVLACPFPAGQRIAVRLERPYTGEPLEVHAEVVHDILQEDGTWLIGCQFMEPLSEKEFDQLMGCENRPALGKTGTS